MQLTRTALSNIFDVVVDVNEIDSSDTAHLALMKRLELGITFTKLHCWTLTQYTKCVFMDADTMVLCNIDDLFDREELSAAPDPGWPDCFNSGVFVFQPSLETFNLLLQFAKEIGSFDGGDQGLLNSFFSNWATKDIKKHLPFLYNLTSSATYTYAPAFEHFGKDAKVVHFLGRAKPWDYKYSPQTNTVLDDGPSSISESQLSFLELWWMTYTSSILPLLGKLQESEIPSEELILSGDDGNTFETGNPFGSSFLPISADLAHVSKLVRNPSSEKPVQNDYFSSHVSYLSIKPRADKMSTEEERRKWEEGHVDYLGKDAFENIKKKLDSFLL